MSDNYDLNDPKQLNKYLDDRRRFHLHEAAQHEAARRREHGRVDFFQPGEATHGKRDGLSPLGFVQFILALVGTSVWMWLLATLYALLWNNGQNPMLMPPSPTTLGRLLYWWSVFFFVFSSVCVFRSVRRLDPFSLSDLKYTLRLLLLYVVLCLCLSPFAALLTVYGFKM